jgi:hypothetical protein
MYRFAAALAVLVFSALPADCKKVPPKDPPKLANRDAVARALPQGMRLEEKFRDLNDGGKVTTVEQKLAELKATVSKDGKLRDGGGKLIFFYKGLSYQGRRPTREQEARARKRLEELHKRGTVIEMAPLRAPK